MWNFALPGKKKKKIYAQSFNPCALQQRFKSLYCIKNATPKTHIQNTKKVSRVLKNVKLCTRTKKYRLN